jgi:hypothetical protein
MDEPGKLTRWVTAWGWLIVVAVVAVVIAVLTIAVGLLLTDGYHDSAHRWVAWAGILAGTTVVVALLGLPVALYQLATVRRDLNRVTRATEFEKVLNANLLEGVELLPRLDRDADGEAAILELGGWVEAVAQYIREETGSEVEEQLFRLEAQNRPPPDELRGKILHLRDSLIPKVRAGYFSQ